MSEGRPELLRQYEVPVERPVADRRHPPARQTLLVQRTPVPSPTLIQTRPRVSPRTGPPAVSRVPELFSGDQVRPGPPASEGVGSSPEPGHLGGRRVGEGPAGAGAGKSVEKGSWAVDNGDGPEFPWAPRLTRSKRTLNPPGSPPRPVPRLGYSFDGRDRTGTTGEPGLPVPLTSPSQAETYLRTRGRAGFRSRVGTRTGPGVEGAVTSTCRPSSFSRKSSVGK